MPGTTMRMSGNWTNSPNGYHEQSRASSSTYSFANGGHASRGFTYKSSMGKMSVVHDAAAALKRKSAAELTAAVSSSVGEMTFVKLVEWIRSERLSSLPHQGSTWDTVLIRSLHVAERLHKFETSISGFAAGSGVAGELAYAHLRLLLEMGHENSGALNKAFSLFYRSSLVINSLLERSDLLSASSEIQEQLCMMFSDLITLIVEVAIHFHKAVSGIANSKSSVSMDLYQEFGETLQTYNDRRSKITSLIWSTQTEKMGDGIEEVPIDTLRRWLMPQDRVLELLGNDHTVFADDLAEFTGLWFQDSLLKFVKGTNECLLVNGASGSGKTTLAATVMERLQRPIARQTCQSVFVTIGEVPAQATSLHLLKSVLYQLLQNRIGNMKLYAALVEAHEDAQRTADPEAYENRLWAALGDILQNPLESASMTVIVVDGLGEIKGGQQAGQKLFERLAVAVGRGRKTKLIAFAESLSLPKSARGSQMQITPEDTSDDRRLVTIRALARCSPFTQKPGPEQDTVIASILDASKGSFIWSILLCECLKADKSPDTFNKTLAALKSTPPSISDLVLRLLTTLQPALDSCLVLAWLTGSARPLTFEELSSLLSINVEKRESGNSSPPVERILEPVRPLLSVSYNVVRPRHGRITEALQTALQSLIDQGKIPLSHKNTQIDLLLRSMICAKGCLPESSAPTLEMSDYSLPARLFPKHPLLEYVVRYWPHHLENTPFSPGQSGTPKLPEEFKQVFPASTAMPTLEYLCWDEQYPGSQEVKLHSLACRLRTTIFTQEHPAVMQGYINCALYYGPMGNDKETSNAYYTACQIGKAVLKPSHPVTVACANYYLEHTSTMVTPTRSEIMTHREQILHILITAYQQQFGMHSEMVLSTQEQLIQLYQYIKEDDKAHSLSQQQEDDAGTNGYTGSDHKYPSSLGGHLNAKLVSRSSQDTQQSTIGLFGDEEEDEEETEMLTISSVQSILESAKALVSQGKHEQAEMMFVQLLRQVSSLCRTTMAVEWHKQKIEAVNAYSKALASSHRQSESSALLMAVAQEYRHHEVSFSQSIVASLTETATVLKSVGHASAALSIFQQTASYYRSTHTQNTKEITQIEEMIATTSTQVTKDATTSSSANSQVAKTSLESIFESTILTKNSKIEASTFALVKQLVERYMEEMQYEKAVEVIQATLQRTWTVFTSDSLHGLTMSTAFSQENLALVESLYQVYMRLRKVDKAMDVYLRLYKATLPVAQQQPKLFEQHYRQLVALYDKYGYFDRAIAVLQEVVPVYIKLHGTDNNEQVIALLFDLGARCRHHARTHGYWIEYYQQIVKATTKDSKVAGATGLEALKIVAVSYWEERRYTEASAAYGLLWATLVDTQKVTFSKDQATYLQSLYQQYFQSLEATQADTETIYRVTKQYHSTCVAAFGASHAVSIAASQALAQVCEQSEKHQSESTQLLQRSYQEMLSSNSAASQSEIRQVTQQLIKVYQRQVTTSSSTSSETVEQLKQLHQQEFSSSYKQFGYRSESTINSLREVALLEFRQNKTEAAVKQITSATEELSTKDFSEEHMVQSATTIASVFQASKQTAMASEYIQELRLQIVATQKSTNSRFKFDATKSSRAALVFLATLEYQLRKDLSLTQSDIYTDLLSERLYYNELHKVTKVRSSFESLVRAAAPLRHYLLKRDRKQQAQSVVQQVVDITNQQELKTFTLEARNTSPNIFIVSILDYMGTRRNAHFQRAVILATNKALRGLVDSNKFAEAYDIALIGFKYAKAHNGYRGAGAISSGFALASYLDGRGENRCPDETLRKKLLQLSNDVVKELLTIAREQKVDLAQVHLTELNELIALLGEQSDWSTLENLLSSLWSAKKAQQSWPSEVLLRLGSRLIAARYLSGQPVKAIRLCEDIAYNLRRTQGNSDPATLDAYRTLVQLYTSTAQMYQKSAGSDKATATLANDYFKKAVLLEEGILRRFASEGSDGEAGDDEDEEDTAATILAEHGVQVNGSADHVNGNGVSKVDRSPEIKQHMRLLKLSYQRLGQWPKPFGVYEQLNANLYRLYGEQLKGVEGVEKWQSKGFGSGKAESAEGTFEAPKQWDIVLA